MSYESVLTNETLGERLKIWAETYGDKIALSDRDQDISFKELEEIASKLALNFYRLGIRPGDHVVLQMTNKVSSIEVLFGMYMLGAYPIMALPAQRENDLEGIFRKVNPVAYFVGESYMGKSYKSLVDYFKGKFPSIKNVICSGHMEGTIPLSSLMNTNISSENYKVGLKNNGRPIEGSDILHILLSGGTTGTPKLIARTHRDYIYCSRKCAKVCKVDESEVYLCALPFSHNFALSSYGIIGTLESGGHVVMCDIPDPDEILSYVEDYKVTGLALVPALLAMCLDVLEWNDEYDISSLRLVVVGGSVFERKDGERVGPLMGCRVQQVFGTAEGLNCMTSLEDDMETLLSCQGKPISEYDEIKIVNENMKEVAEGEKGELITRGPYTIKSYYMADSGVNERSFTVDGFYRTGDKAYIRPDGNIVIVGRAKEQINKGGEKIMPSEIEEILCKIEGIKLAAVVGKTDEVLGNKIAAFVVSDRKLSLQEVRSFFKEKGIVDYKWPDTLTIMEDFPLTKVGKIDKVALGKIAEGERENE